MIFDKLKELLGGDVDTPEKAIARLNAQKEANLQKATKILTRDFSEKAAQYKFYINNNYDKPYTQKEWMELYTENCAANDPQLMVPMYNAIVVTQVGLIYRRGLELLGNRYLMFSPGENDEITNTFAVEPYTYIKVKSARSVRSSAPARSASSTPTHAAPTAQPAPARSNKLSFSERAELNQARARYNAAVESTQRHPNSKATYEALEKQAYADYMRVMAKYAGRE